MKIGQIVDRERMERSKGGSYGLLGGCSQRSPPQRIQWGMGGWDVPTETLCLQWGGAGDRLGTTPGHWQLRLFGGGCNNPHVTSWGAIFVSSKEKCAFDVHKQWHGGSEDVLRPLQEAWREKKHQLFLLQWKRQGSLGGKTIARRKKDDVLYVSAGGFDAEFGYPRTLEKLRHV